MGNYLTSYRRESIWDARGIVASCVAPLLPALIFATLSRGNFLFLLIVGMTIAYAQMLVLGLPLLALLNWRRKVSALNVAVVTFVAAALPWVVTLDSVILSDHFVHGMWLTSDNWFTLLAAPFILGAYGLGAGFAWWVIASPLEPRTTPVHSTIQ